MVIYEVQMKVICFTLCGKCSYGLKHLIFSFINAFSAPDMTPLFPMQLHPDPPVSRGDIYIYLHAINAYSPVENKVIS